MSGVGGGVSGATSAVSPTRARPGAPGLLLDFSEAGPQVDQARLSGDQPHSGSAQGGWQSGLQLWRCCPVAGDPALAEPGS